MWMQNQECWDRKVVPFVFGNDGLLVGPNICILQHQVTLVTQGPASFEWMK